MKIRRRYLIFGVMSVFLLVALLIWRENTNIYRAQGGETYSRMRQAIMIIDELPNNEVPDEESELIALLKSKWPTTRDDGPAENQILDGWGRPLAFSYQDTILSWKITSADRDGQFGTSDDKESESLRREINGEPR